MSEVTEKPSVPQLDDYLRSQVAPRFAELVKGAEQRAAAAQKELEDLRAAAGTMAWEISSDTPLVRYVNIANGAMQVADQPAAAPFMTVSQTEGDWARFTAGMAGMFGADPNRPLGRSRLERMRTLNGAVRFVISGLSDGSSWTCTIYFGSGPRPAEPKTTISVGADVVAKIQARQIEPQIAFMQGQLKIAGDAGFAMQLGMALFM